MLSGSVKTITMNIIMRNKHVAYGLLLCVSFLLVFFTASAERYQHWEIDVVSGEHISRVSDYKTDKAIAKASEEMWDTYVKEIEDRKRELSRGKITIQGVSMELYMHQVGHPEKNGYPLYLILHGGGIIDAKVQREQYEIMKDYCRYQQEPGLYVATKSLIPHYDEHYRPESFLFYDRIIEDAIAFYHADPNRIYLYGFSSGGDGVYSISPCMPDRFAAVVMCAGTPQSMRIRNMRNLPICLQVGEKDNDFDRNRILARYDALLQTLSDKYGGYLHDTYIHVDSNHNQWDNMVGDKHRVITGENVQKWLNGEKYRTTLAVTEEGKWLPQFTRDPFPEKVVWETAISAGLRPSQSFYWLDRDGFLSDENIVASYSRENNTITISECTIKQGTLKILLNPQMMDVFADVTIDLCGAKIQVNPFVSRQIMETTLREKGDPNLIYTTEIDLRFDKKHRRIEVESVRERHADYSVTDPERLIYWRNSGLMIVDPSLLGMTFQELSSRLNVKVHRPKPWPYGEEGWDYSELTLHGKNLTFMFRDGKCRRISCQEEGEIPAT